uniref:Uncharacterized protein n=1 Tax=Cyanothece sp. (strain PCC 7425 / ATCC 29141) TaxID=395961 RepID=B8HSQ6_CYAP4
MLTEMPTQLFHMKIENDSPTPHQSRRDQLQASPILGIPENFLYNQPVEYSI